MKKHPGTAGSMPVKGSGCGIRPDLDELGADTGFDFSAAADLLAAAGECKNAVSESAPTTTKKEKTDQ